MRVAIRNIVQRLKNLISNKQGNRIIELNTLEIF